MEMERVWHSMVSTGRLGMKGRIGSDRQVV